MIQSWKFEQFKSCCLYLFHLILIWGLRSIAFPVRNFPTFPHLGGLLLQKLCLPMRLCFGYSSPTISENFFFFCDCIIIYVSAYKF